ncbi:D-alanyl-D-alanine dipeptidase [Verminephrobacter aporrectodeae subsp. tuberculatae]|uniref:D-alanyl-D-alanine dipeptidase n=1 Tax=Verminephrobacter aporrectodeae TaxID=1110389 RepID=UPI002237028C|nr:D-alanyl-D-alanine dipeptidase [Verminephrobacter aporrectodeae]MCW5255224.1 D-alanyl-D-alanine dipeptidase [Verminephrobacter aporrectodeae subsp. tuberculatae]
MNATHDPMLLETISHPSIDIDLLYASADNLTRRPIYQRTVALLHPHALQALLRAAALAAAQNLRLRVFDAYRPVAAQWLLWKVLPAPNFVADPRQGPMHSRGVAVDLTLANSAGEPLDMGTDFDDMTAQSGHGRIDVPIVAQRNRALLLGLMVASGFAHNPKEWWHYNLPHWRDYPPLSDEVEGLRLMNFQAAGADSLLPSRER